MNNKPYWIAPCGMALGSLLLMAAPMTRAADATDAGHLSLGAGADYSSGKYGTSVTTDIWSVPFTAAYRADRWTFKLVVPYISVTGASNVIPGAGPVSNVNPSGRGRGRSSTGTTTVTETSGSASGLGDVVASAGYELFSSADRTFGLDLTGKVKFGTADENKGLGTGKNDYGVSLDAYKVAGDWTPFGGVGWTRYGSSQYIRLKNAFNANLGVDYKLSSNDHFGGYYYYRERVVSGGPSQSELTAYWNHKLGQSWRVQSYVLGGLANGSPDWGAGASVKYTF